MMRIIALLLVTGAIVLTGCSRRYVVTLTNGTQLTTSSKPKFERGNYYFKDAFGQVQSVPGGRVKEIAPASMAEKENGSFKPSVK